MRSRGKKGAGRTERDLIEAGLSEPAGWRGRLWGLCQRSVVRDPALAESDDDLGRLIVNGGGDCGRQSLQRPRF